MRVPFIKMHGLGNDFVVLDGRAQPLPALTGPSPARWPTAAPGSAATS
jgi:diaminopimelate epimerase